MMEPVVSVAAPFTPLRFPRKATLILAICQIIAGVIWIVLNSFAIAFPPNYALSDTSAIGYGIWGGIACIIAGGLELGARKRGDKCLVIATMVLSIVSAVIALLFVVLFSLIHMIHGCYHHCQASVFYLINILLFVSGLLEAVAAIWTSALCCKLVCCTGNMATTGVIPVQYVATAPQQNEPLVYLPQYGQQDIASGNQTPPPVYEEKVPL